MSKANKERPVQVVQDAEVPVPVEILAESIKAISEGIRRLQRGPMSQRAIEVLIREACPRVGGKYNARNISLSEVRAVLAGIEQLATIYLKS